MTTDDERIFRIEANLRVTFMIPGKSTQDVKEKALSPSGTISEHLIDRHVLHGHYDITSLTAKEVK